MFGSLCAAKADFDFGDEDMLARLGAVESGPDGVRLRIGKMTYRTVVVPKMLTMRASTLEWLKAFGEQGGEVWFTAGRPEYVDAQRSAQANTIPGLDRELADVETALIARAPVTITGESGDLLRQVYAQVRQTENGWIVMLLNMDRRQSCRAVLHFRRGGRLDRWDPRHRCGGSGCFGDGGSRSYPPARRGGRSVVYPDRCLGARGCTGSRCAGNAAGMHGGAYPAGSVFLYP